MDRPKRLPFHNLTAENWLNLAAVGVLAFYTIYFVFELVLGRLCGQVGVDYCAYWSAGRVATAYGHQSVYDTQVLYQVERSILPAQADPATNGKILVPYLPLFILPFQFLALIPPLPGFVAWISINLALFLLYMRNFTRRGNLRALPLPTMLMILASPPVFENLWSGQLSVWLMLCAGEFLRALVDRKPLRAGLWLGGFMLKPQLLVLVVPILLLHRSFRVLAGLAICSLLVGLSSLALVGPEGLHRMLAMWWQAYAAGQANSSIEGMMNFRMLGFHMAAVLTPWIAWGLAATGMLAVAALAMQRWRRPFDPAQTAVGAAMLGILAATTMTAWHSHIHMAVVLLPSMMLLYQAGALPVRAFHCWVLAPAVLFILTVFLPPALARLPLVSDPRAPVVYLPMAAAQLIATLYLFRWSLRYPTRRT